MEKINKTETLSEILSNKTFTVNVYQREYRWGRKQIEQMINDLYDTFIVDYEAGKHESTKEVQSYGYYFMGSIIRTGDDSTREIIDGQQRLTSLTLLLMYINRALHDNGNYKLDSMIPCMIYSSPFGDGKTFNIDVPDRTECMENLYEGNTNFTPQNESSQTLLDRYGDIVDLFPTDITAEVLPYFAFWVIHKVLLLEIVTPSEKEATTIFITMNDRGLSLNSAEMLKAYVLNEVASDDKPKVNKQWQDIVNSIKNAAGADQSGVVNTADVDFISVWLRGKYARTLREGKKDSADKDYELLGEKFHTWVRQNARTQMGLISAASYKDFVLSEMKQMANVYLRIKDYSKKFTAGFETVFYNANRDLNYQTLLMISAIDKNDPQDVVDQKIKLVAQFVDIYASRKILNYSKPNWNTRKVFLFKTMVNIRNQSVRTIGIILTKALLSDGLEWPYFDQLRYDNQFFKRYALHFLARFTSYINEQMGNPSQFDAYTDRSSKNPYDIEHILPDAFGDYSELFTDEREFSEYRQKLGNLLILTKDHNRSYQDMPYSTKVQHYMADNILAQAMNPLAYQNNPLFIPVAKRTGIKPYTQMDKASIEERHAAYLALAKEIWSIDHIRNLCGDWTQDEYDQVSFESASRIIDRDDTVGTETAWVIPGNPNYYDVAASFAKYSEIEWSQHANFKVGDTIYIYLSYPRSEIGFKCLVKEVGIPFSKRKIDDAEFYKGKATPAEKYMRIQLVKSYPAGSLTRDMLLEKGVTTNFQGPTKVRKELADAISTLD